jgi:hypothetical protein
LSARGASFHTKHAKRKRCSIRVKLDANSYLALWKEIIGNALVAFYDMQKKGGSDVLLIPNTYTGLTGQDAGVSIIIETFTRIVPCHIRTSFLLLGDLTTEMKLRNYTARTNDFYDMSVLRILQKLFDCQSMTSISSMYSRIVEARWPRGQCASACDRGS